MDNLENELKDLKGFIAELKADRAATKEKEKRESWIKYVSLTVVVIAVLGSIASGWSGKYGSRVQLSQAKASDSWNLYQARSVKGHLLEVTTNTLANAANAGDPAVQKMLKDYAKDVAKYNAGKEESQRIARAYEEDRDAAEALGKKLGPSIPLFSVSIAMASMCLLTKKKPLWLVAILMAAIATVMMLSARVAQTPPKGPQAEQAALAQKAPPPEQKQAGTN
jgi:nitrate reductase NapE component